jgi:hypothetical protein
MNAKVENLSNTVLSGIAQARDVTTDTLDSAKRTVDHAVDRGKGLASDAATATTGAVKSARQKGSELADAATGLAAELEAMTRQNPLVTVIGSVFVGVLIGMMARGTRQ